MKKISERGESMDYKNREGMLPSEKAKLYKRLYSDMKVAVEVVPEEAPKKGRPKKAENGKKKREIRLDEEMALSVGESRNQLHRYLRLAEVIPELLELVDRKRIALSTAVDISFLDICYQQLVYQYVSEKGTITSYQVAALRKYIDAEGTVTKDAFQKLMRNQMTGGVNEEKIVLRQKVLRQYFPAEYSTEEMEKVILHLIEDWSKGGHAE